MAKKKGPLKGVQRGVNKANISLQSISSVLEQQTQTLQQITEASAQVQDDKSGGGSAQLIAIQIARAQLQLQQDANTYLKKIQAGQNKQIESLQKSNKDWKGFGDKFKDFKRNMADAFDINTIKKKLLGPFTMFKGARDKMEDLDYVKRMKALGSTKTTKELRADAASSRGFKENALRSQDEINRLKKLGASDDQIRQTDAYRNRNAALGSYNQLQKVDNKSARDAANPMGGNTAGQSAPLPKTPSDKGMVSQSTTDLAADQQAAHENQVEMLRLTGMQTDLLQQIATNTSLMAGNSSSSAGGSEDAGKSGGAGRALNGISSAFKGIGDSVGSLGSGIGKGIGGLIGGVFSGIMMGIADGISAFGTAKVVKGTAVLGLLAGVVYGFSQAFDSFSQIDWDSVNKGLLAIAAVTAAAALVGKFVDKIALGAAAIGLLGGALWVVGQAFQAVGDGFNSMNDGLQKLSQLDGGNLFTVAGGIAAIGASLAMFGAGQVAAGLGTLIGNLLTIGQDSPIDQLAKLAGMGDDLMKASQGIDSIGQAMVGFSKVDKKAIDALNDFPWIRATAFVAAGGAMEVAGSKVYAASKDNADQQAQVDGKAGKSGPAQINQTQVNQNSSSTTAIKPSSRNTESSYTKYLSARY